MIYQLFSNITLSFLLFLLLDYLYSTKLSVPVTIYVGDAFNNTSTVHLFF